jgi:hypothetical protein
MITGVIEANLDTMVQLLPVAGDRNLRLVLGKKWSYTPSELVRITILSFTINYNRIDRIFEPQIIFATDR